uniref:NOP14 nucleolar protein homolog (yeast) n=1 Tax=Gouania willdenowi TaxID=441366 RepID=A0A8C5EWD3_GOUWI
SFKSLADKVRKTKTSTEIKNNPFEVKINRKKFEVLGQKIKHDVGLPGVSRSKAIKKRKDTLLKEYKQKNKSNKFIDRRFGEYDTKMAPEDKILQRFAMERQRGHDKKDVYNLNEEEELTHYGQSLAEMEKFTDAGNSDDETEEKGLLSAELTASHFGGGGGLLRKKGPGDQEEEGGQRTKSRQELIEELIQKSKQEKRERQVKKEEAQELTEKLDQEWKSIQALMVKKTPKDADAEKTEEKPKVEEYDMMVRELGFEMKAQPSEKLKTPEELAREETEKLQKLEADRLRRMMGDEGRDSSQHQVHMSADDLNDGFILDKHDKKTLAYEVGNSAESGEDQETDAEEEEDDDEDGKEESAEEEGEGSIEKEDDDGHSDLDSEEEESENEEENEDDDVVSVPKPKKKSVTKEEQEAAKAELPYTFTAPENYNCLKNLLNCHTPDNQRLIVARMQKSNHPSLAVGNKLKLQNLLGFLLEYVGELATRNPPDLLTVDKLIPIHLHGELYTLCQMFPEAARQALQSIMGDVAHSMEEVIEVNGHAPFPTLDMLIYLKVIALLFPTSDFRHPVTTPALLFIGQALTKCPVRSLQDLTSGLVLCCLAVEYVSLSKRFLPELINFLFGTLHLAVQDKTSLGSYSVVPPFRRSGKHCDLLVVSDSESISSWSRKSLPLSACKHLELEEDRDRDQLTCLSTCLDLVKRCCLLYKELTSFTHIFQPIRVLLSKHLSSQTLPDSLQELQSEIVEMISSAPAAHRVLVFDKKKPIPLKLLTPKIVEVLDYGKKRGSSREEREQERLKHKYKKEFKGALREIRKDSRFLAREKLSEVMNRDAERKRKVRELFGSLATQEGEWKALKRRKRK